MIQKLQVLIQFDAERIRVGELVRQDQRIYFKYDPDFIKRGLEISPYHLKLSDQILSENQHPFEGLFGVFADSLPDAWGRLLLDRTLASRGINLQQLSPLDRLAYVGDRGMGALIYEPELDDHFVSDQLLELDLLAAESTEIMSGSGSEFLEELHALGGSSGGARPKIMVAFNPETGDFIHGSKILKPGYEPWIIKFNAKIDRMDAAQIEYAYHQMALDCGLEMADCRLLEGRSGTMYFATKRFDRTINHRIHMHTAAGLLRDNYQVSSLDYGHLMSAVFDLEKNVLAYEKVLRLASFNVFASNRDDHSKNVSFLMNGDGNWSLAPAYDLTFSSSAHGHHSTMISGESKNPTTKHLQKLADHFLLKEGSQLIESVKTVVANWPKYASACGVGKESKALIWKTIQRQLN